MVAELKALSINLRLPAWAAVVFDKATRRSFPTIKDRMRFVIYLSYKNVKEKTGGPFGAGVFNSTTGQVVSVGVNIVVPSNCSLAHAEAVAIMLAEQTCGTYDLSAEGLPPMELVTSAQPCVQCFGNVWWSGIKRVIFGATADDVERLTGFDEGPIHPEWAKLIENRPQIQPAQVIRNVLRHEACEVLKLYSEDGGKVYNAGSDSKIHEDIDKPKSRTPQSHAWCSAKRQNRNRITETVKGIHHYEI